MSLWLFALMLAAQAPELVSPLGKRFHAQPDKDGSIAKADAALAADPHNTDLLLAAARARDAALQFSDAIRLYTRGIERAPGDFRLYRYRGHRYISTRRFDDAVRDLEKARQLAPSSWDVSYHLALAYYLRGQFERAADEYARCASLAATDDSRVAVADWRYRALRRAGRHAEALRLLDDITEKMAVKENQAYYRALLFYKALLSETEILQGLTGNQFATVGYAVANYQLVDGLAAEACEFFRRITEDPNWNAFGYIAAEAELSQGRCR